MPTPTFPVAIVLKPLNHKSSLRIAIFFEINFTLNTKIKTVKGAAWSRTHKCWHIPYKVKAYEQALSLLEGFGEIDIEQLKQYQEEKFAVKLTLTAPPILDERMLPVQPARPVGKKIGENRTEISAVNRALLEQTRGQLQLKAYSSSTIKTYLNELSVFFSILGGADASAMKISRVKDYLLYCINVLQLKENTIHSRLNALKFFYEKVLGKEKFFVDIPRPKKHLQLPKVLGESELRRLFAAPVNLKHKAILFVAYSAGLRVSEVINLRLQDIDRERKQLFVHCSKGKKDRYVNLSVLVLDVLEQYYKMAKQRPVNFLFEGLEPGKPYTTRSAQTIFSKAKEKAGIAKTLSFHSLRHSFATHLLEKGVDSMYIRDILGHFDIKTTERYLHVRKEMLINISSPIDDLYKRK